MFRIWREKEEAEKEAERDQSRDYTRRVWHPGNQVKSIKEERLNAMKTDCQTQQCRGHWWPCQEQFVGHWGKALRAEERVQEELVTANIDNFFMELCWKGEQISGVLDSQGSEVKKKDFNFKILIHFKMKEVTACSQECPRSLCSALRTQFVSGLALTHTHFMCSTLISCLGIVTKYIKSTGYGRCDNYLLNQISNGWIVSNNSFPWGNKPGEIKQFIWCHAASKAVKPELETCFWSWWVNLEPWLQCWWLRGGEGEFWRQRNKRIIYDL